MALKFKYTDEHGILHINMSPTSTPGLEESSNPVQKPTGSIDNPKFDSINNRFGTYDLFGGKYDCEQSSGDEKKSLFTTRYNSIEEELANTPYAFATERTFRYNTNSPLFDITIKSIDNYSPSKDIENDRFFTHLDFQSEDDLFGPQIDFEITSKDETPAFTVTQLIHAQDRYFDLSSRQNTSLTDEKIDKDNKNEVKKGRVKSLTSQFEVKSVGEKRTVRIDEGVKSENAFKILSGEELREKKSSVTAPIPIIPTAKRKREKSFAIIAETPPVSRPSSPRSLPVDIRTGRSSPFRGRGFREETSRHNTPKTSAANSRATSPHTRRRTCSLSKLDNMASTATLPPPIHLRPHSPRNFVKENIIEVREMSELNREKHEAEAEQKRMEEEEALQREMEIFEKSREGSRMGSKASSRTNSPSKLTQIKIRSRSNSPLAILHFENIPAPKEFMNGEAHKPVTHNSRMRSLSKSQPQSNNASPKHSKIPKRQNSVSPTRGKIGNRRPVENNLKNNQRFISNSTSRINETSRSTRPLDRTAMSKSTQHLNITTTIKGKPPISPGKTGPPPTNRSINAKRLSPIVGTPNKSPVEDPKAKRSNSINRKPISNTTTIPRNSIKKPVKPPSRDNSPEKKTSKTTKQVVKSVSRTSSNRSIKPAVPSKPDAKKPIDRTSSNKSLNRTSSTKNLNDKASTLKKTDSKKDLKPSQSGNSLNEMVNAKEPVKDSKSETKDAVKESENTNNKAEATTSSSTEEVTTQDNETQYDKIINDKGELVIMTKKNVVSMTTAAITAQPLEVVTTVTNQLPAALERAREKGMFERHSSKDSLSGAKTDDNDERKTKPRTIFGDDSIKLKPLQPPYNNPQIEKVKQKIDDILKSPEVSTENILAAVNAEVKAKKNTFKNLADKTKQDLEDTKNETANKLIGIKDEVIKQQQKATEDIKIEAKKIVDSIITPVEEPKALIETAKNDIKNIEPIVMVVNEKQRNGPSSQMEKSKEKLIQGAPEVEVNSSNMNKDKMAATKMADGGSDKSSQSNGGLPQSSSTTPKPPPRTHRNQSAKTEEKQPPQNSETETKKPNICKRLYEKCAQKTKCCACCVKPNEDEQDGGFKKAVEKPANVAKEGMISKWNCCKKKDEGEEVMKKIEKAAEKTSIDFETETRSKSRRIRDALCGCCRTRRVSDASRDLSPASEVGCCGKRRASVRRDSILSDRPNPTCCNNRFTTWLTGCCRRAPPPSRRPSMFSKNKSLTPTLPPEDTRPKLDASLVEHTSLIRGAVPVLPVGLAWFCLVCNVILPGLGSIFSGIFCLCFGIPRFGVHDGVKQRIGSFVINLLVGCGQLFTVLFCLVGWGWSIWWGVIMVRVARKYRKIKAEEAANIEEEAPPITANNHTAA